MLMPRVSGLVVETRPSYTRAGWLAESEPSFQAALLDDFLRTLAGLHRQNPAIVDAPVVVAADAFAGACDYLDWASGGAVIPEYLVEARAWCSREVPVSISCLARPAGRRVPSGSTPGAARTGSLPGKVLGTVGPISSRQRTTAPSGGAV